jgi:uncharacterized protein (DUF2252 family)
MATKEKKKAAAAKRGKKAAAAKRGKKPAASTRARAAGNGQPPILGAQAARIAEGKKLREQFPLEAHAEWSPAEDRPDAVELLEQQAADRLPELVPLRRGRMASSPFAFYRGAAIVMAEDLAGTPSTGLSVQACGDAHLANFGVFATPERNLVFDLNDFDETLPGPWEWDLKRLASSLVIAGRHRSFDAAANRAAVVSATRTYALRMREFAAMRQIEVWYSRIDVDQLLALAKGAVRKRAEKGAQKARTRDALQAQAKLTEVVDGRRRIRNDPPLVVSMRDTPVTDDAFIKGTLDDYAKTLDDDRQYLLSRYEYRDVALKVVGVGSVGTRCFIVLLEGSGDTDPLFLQVKEATHSVLERYQGKSAYDNHGRRVVEGQRLTQAASDIFLGWIRGRGDEHRDFYWRQLRDMKGSVDLEIIEPEGFGLYAELCGAALARAHARSGDAAAITGYIGTGPVFPQAIASFAEAYADQNERDHAGLVEAISSGRLQAQEGI